LIELVMVIVILGILAAAITPFLVGSMRAYRTTASDLDTLGRLRYATERMVRELRDVNYTTVSSQYVISPLGANQTTVTFTKTGGAQITFTLTGSTVTMSDSSIGAGTVVLTDQVVTTTGLVFNYYYYDASNNLVATASAAQVQFVDVQLRLLNPDNGQTYEQRTRVMLRDRS
jgi:type II secretory pathway pseudopilin PulG